MSGPASFRGPSTSFEVSTRHRHRREFLRVEPPLTLSAGRARTASEKAARLTHDEAISETFACCT